MRKAAWAIIVALAAFQAYAQRFVVSPDGMSYLDLSDAVVTGQWSRLANLYWSPLHPLLIGIARAVFRVGPRYEIALIHALAVVYFIAMFAAFEYMLMSILMLAKEIRGSLLGSRCGTAVAYALFGSFALTMTPLELTTPDLLSNAAVFVAFGAMLRLRDDPDRSTRHAIILGLALGIGALAKSFMVPWAVVCLATVAVAMRRDRHPDAATPDRHPAASKRRRTRFSVVIATGVWLVFVLPWSLLLSVKAGRPTFGDAGRLTYAWYVNDRDAPSLGGVPPGARTAETERILPGVGVTRDTSYSDPMWADPARWNRGLEPTLSLRDQLKTLKVFHIFYVDNLAPLLFLIFLIAVAPRGSRRVAWYRGWIVYIPALAGLFGYAMVVVTTRYVMAYILAGTLVLLASLPVGRRLVPLYVLFGLVIPVALEAIYPQTAEGLSLVILVIGGVLAATLIPSENPFVWGTLAILLAVATRIIFPPFAENLTRVGGAALAVLVWRVALSAIRNNRAVWFARRAFAALGLILGVVFAWRTTVRLLQDRGAMRSAAHPRWGNLPWAIATDLASHGITPGTRIALIGPHAESYWVRTARLHIVGNVPRNRVEGFWRLSSAGQDSLLAEFRAAGATVGIATLGIAGEPPDSTRWSKLQYHGRFRRMAP